MSVSVKAADRADLIRELENARDTLIGWAERVAVTPGDTAFLLTALDNAAASVGRAVTAAKVTYPKESGGRPV